MLKLFCPGLGLEHTLLELTPGSPTQIPCAPYDMTPHKSKVQYIKVIEINYMLDKEPLHIVNIEKIWSCLQT